MENGTENRLNKPLNLLSNSAKKALDETLIEIISALEFSSTKEIIIPSAPNKCKTYEYVVNVILLKNIDFDNTWNFLGSNVLPFRIEISKDDFDILVLCQKLISEKIETLTNQKIEEKGKLTLNISTGEVIFISKTGNQYKEKMKTGKNEFLLLKAMSQSPFRVISIPTLANILNKPRNGADEPDKDRRVRDTIKSIKDSLGLRGVDRKSLFIVNLGFGLNCVAETVS